MIAVDKIRIRGFRGIASLEMRLERTTVLIGPNNCGKTSVLKALQLALFARASRPAPAARSKRRGICFSIGTAAPSAGN